MVRVKSSKKKKNGKRFMNSRFYYWYNFNWERLEQNEWRGQELIHHLAWLGLHVAAILFATWLWIFVYDIGRYWEIPNPIKVGGFYLAWSIPIVLVLFIILMVGKLKEKGILEQKKLIHIVKVSSIICLIVGVLSLAIDFIGYKMQDFLPNLGDEIEIAAVIGFSLAAGIPLLFVMEMHSERNRRFYIRLLVLSCLIMWLYLVLSCIAGENAIYNWAGVKKASLIEQDWKGNEIHRGDTYSSIYWFNNALGTADYALEKKNGLMEWRGDFQSGAHIETNSIGLISGAINSDGNWIRIEYYGDGSIKRVISPYQITCYGERGDSVFIVNDKGESWRYISLSDESSPKSNKTISEPDEEITSAFRYISLPYLCKRLATETMNYSEEVDTGYDKNYVLVEKRTYYGESTSGIPYGGYKLEKFDHYDDGRLKSKEEICRNLHTEWVSDDKKYNEWLVYDQVYTYDPEGNQISNTLTIYDNINNKLEEDEYNSDGKMISRTLFDMGGNRISYVEYDNNGKVIRAE